MPKLTIDDREIEVPNGLTVLQACELAGVEIPRFCYHERLSVAGNCRMCLVEMERAPKPIASCAMPVGEGMVIKTDTPTVHKARKGVMEFLLINHPLDCPICDQGGECDLQDQAMAFGFDRSRYTENKRAVKEKYMGPLIKTIMTRCIQCTRCVRFSTEIAGVEEIGLVNRGEHAEITTLEKAVDSELSGNLVDVCPVGALTSKPYAFSARPWELRKTNSVDVMDAVGSNIRVDTRGREVMRVLPRLHEGINEEWIADKTRHACDGLGRQRIDQPYVRRDGKLTPASWEEAFGAIAAKVKGLSGDRMAAIAGDLCDTESMFALKQLMNGLGSENLDCRQDGAKLDSSTRAAYLFNSGIAGIEETDAVLLVGTNPRWEAPLINARLRKRFLASGLKVAAIGAQADLSYPVEYLGAGGETLKDVAEGRSSFSEVLKSAERPMIIVGMGALARADGGAVLALARKIADDFGMVSGDWNGFNVLHTAAARVGGMDVGFLPGEAGRDLDGILDGAGTGEIELVYLLGADEIDMERLGTAFVVYQGHHGDAGAHRADVVLPGAAYTEKNGTYVNTEGRVQLGRLAGFPPGDAREDWTILRALSAQLGEALPYDNLGQLRAKLIEANPVFAVVDQAQPGSWKAFGSEGDLDSAPFISPVTNYYMTDPISRASDTMAKCTETFVLGKQEGATETDG
ncbi:NADH-quinone oxidoreductase subunit NuoG [Denitrobaculum tricleocarpae]|uniref:NADH-quinone oxidoreductase n=1 Tax=Denitrobaculum tricleocarpae TaxID=2591009 RepID=A0A545TPF7_9PROT|nr:NADH-quinone oxidoreductase subunit NuoG [Denitrobaculum tricleocarpae]TQV79102.1 NADH-quinone oxidoreductase subunit G [Denitrobaculum tricleocarpae]